MSSQEVLSSIREKTNELIVQAFIRDSHLTFLTLKQSFSLACFGHKLPHMGEVNNTFVLPSSLKETLLMRLSSQFCSLLLSGTRAFTSLDSFDKLGCFVLSFNGETFHFRIFGTNLLIQEVSEILNEFATKGIPIRRWRMEGTKPTTSNSFILSEEGKKVKPSHYPTFKPRELDALGRRFFKSSANVLVIMGPPGTGKTSLARRLLLAHGEPINVCSDVKLLKTDPNPFITGEGNVLIDDVDEVLTPRTGGNPLMSSILNRADGLEKTKGKIIVITNLTSTSKIDPALLRPGRCFAVINVPLLNNEQAKKIASSKKLRLDEDKAFYSLAEVLNSDYFQKNTIVSSSRNQIGFIG